MKILAVESSASPASTCIIDDGKVLSSAYINVKMTHSQTLLPMIKNCFDVAKLSIDDIDAVAVSNGPGSFTGIRIGIAAVKGLAMKKNLPCAGISTLAAMAQLHKAENSIICAVMDARCNQVYNALFRIKNGIPVRLCGDRVLMCEELAKELKTKYNNEKIVVTGDGADLFYSYVNDGNNIKLAAEYEKYQNSVGVGYAAIFELQKGNAVSPAELLPVYLRLPQAERELKRKNKD